MIFADMTFDMLSRSSSEITELFTKIYYYDYSPLRCTHSLGKLNAAAIFPNPFQLQADSNIVYSIL